MSFLKTALATDLKNLYNHASTIGFTDTRFYHYMKTKLFFLTLSCLLFFATMGQTQTLWVIETQDGASYLSSNPEKDFPEAVSKYPFRPLLRVFTTRDGVKKLVDAAEEFSGDDSDDFGFETSFI